MVQVLSEPQEGTRLGAESVSRRFGKVAALSAVTLSVRPGTVHALLGENGAGKTTLIRCLSGLDTPDEGSVVINDERVRLRGPKAANAAGVAVVQQELALAPGLTLLENLILGQEPHSGPVIGWASARARAEELAAEIGAEIDWDAPARTVPIGTLQQVEIVRALYRGADTLILDEPTAVLAPAQIEQLLALLSRMRDAGRTLVFITHKLDEVLAIADRVTVLRAGEVVAEQEAGGLTRDELAELVVGARLDAVPDSARAVLTGTPLAEEPPGTAEQATSGGVGDTVLAVADLEALDQRGRPKLGPVSADVRAGEIVGIAGVAGSGQDELVAAITGLRPPRRGSVTLAGHDVSKASMAERRKAGLGYIAADRKQEGLSLDSSLTDNVIAGVHRDPPVGRRGWISPRAAAKLAGEVLSRFGVRFGSQDDPASSLSGGNQQRIVVGRELSRDPSIVVAVQPTRGVDIRGIRDIHAELLEARKRGAAILLVSEDLDELLALSDRVHALHRGHLSEPVDPSLPDAKIRIGALMLGDDSERRATA